MKKLPGWDELNGSEQKTAVHYVMVHDNPNGSGMYPSQGRVAGRLGVRRETVNRHLRRIVAVGVFAPIQWRSFGGRRSTVRYALGAQSSDIDRAGSSDISNPEVVTFSGPDITANVTAEVSPLGLTYSKGSLKAPPIESFSMNDVGGLKARREEPPLSPPGTAALQPYGFGALVTKRTSNESKGLPLTKIEPGASFPHFGALCDAMGLPYRGDPDDPLAHYVYRDARETVDALVSAGYLARDGAGYRFAEKELAGDLGWLVSEELTGAAA